MDFWLRTKKPHRFTYISESTQRTFLYINKNFILTKNPGIFFETIDTNQIVTDIKKTLGIY
jgi:hypothetical protein